MSGWADERVWRKSPRAPFARVGKGLSADFVRQVAGTVKRTGETVEFLLNTGGHARQNEHQQLEKKQFAVANECLEI